MAKIEGAALVGGGAIIGGLAGYFLGHRISISSDMEKQANRVRFAFIDSTITKGVWEDTIKKPLFSSNKGKPTNVWALIYANHPEAILKVIRWADGYTIEVTRLGWANSKIYFDNKQKAEFSSIDKHDIVSLGYWTTFIAK